MQPTAHPVRPRALSPPQLLILSFAGLVAAGTLLLLLPWASAGATRLPVHAALFTATSAVCVTGLIVLDTPVDLSAFGQVVVLLLIQAGGLGYMTFSTLVGVALGRRITLQERQTLVEGLNAFGPGEVVRFARGVFKVTAVIELVGALVLGSWWAGTHGLVRGAWLGVFHSVSAFNNAGFSLFSDNLRRRGRRAAGAADRVTAGDPRRHRLLHHPRGGVTATAGPPAVGALPARAQRLGSAAHRGHGRDLLPGARQPADARRIARQARRGWRRGSSRWSRARRASTRSPSAPVSPSALFVMVILMFIGGAPGSTAGGVKVTTVGVMLAALWATARGESDATIFRRRIPQDQIARAFLICLVAFLAVNGLAAVLLAREGPSTAADAVRGRVGLRHGRHVDRRGDEPAEPQRPLHRGRASC